MAELPKIVKSRLVQQRSADHAEHPDANLLAAFAEQTLLERERASISAHLAQCADCRESLALVSMIGLVLFFPKSEPTVSFQTAIAGFRLPPVQKSITVPMQATGKGHSNATNARGTITFYNGQTYTQIIPVGTILQGADMGRPSRLLVDLAAGDEHVQVTGTADPIPAA